MKSPKKSAEASFTLAGKLSKVKKPKSLSPVKKDQPKEKYGKLVKY